MLFDFYVVDTDNSTMQVICFNSIVNKFYNIITMNKVYTISNGHVKNNNNNNSNSSNKYFSSYNECQYKLILSDESTVTETTNTHDIERFFASHESQLPTHNDTKPLSFTSIDEILHTIDFGTVINTYGIVKSVGNVMRLQTKHGEIDMKRVIITDTAPTDIEVTLWRNHSNMCFTVGDVIVLLHVKVGKYKTKNISTLTESVITVNPSPQVLTQYNIQSQVNALQHEFIKPNDKEIETILNKVDVFSNSTTYNNVNDVNAYPENETQFDTLHNVYSVLLTEQSSLKTFPLFTVKATVVAFEHKYNNYYAGCPFNKCLRKVFYQQSKWKCNHCNKAYDKPQYYFSIKITIGDCSAIKTLTLFDRPASAFLGTTASQYKEYITHKNDSELDKLLKCVIDQQFVFVLQPKINKNGSNGGVTKRINVLSVRKYTPSKDNNVLLNYIKSVIMLT
jgi:replication factor A1